MQEVYTGDADIVPITDLTVKTLAKQVADSYNTSLEVDYTTPDAEMLTRLTRDVWQFGAAKNYQQLRDLTLLLKDENGKVREWNDFKKEAAKICGKYNEDWLRTEYNTAIGSSIMASRWVQFENEAGELPYLQYNTVGDDAVRPAHQVLDGITRPVGDTFWNTYYPPNGWGCRCDVVQVPVSIARETPAEQIPDEPVQPMFRTNLAKTGLIFPKNHPYYDGVPRAEIRKTMAYLPPQNTFVQTFFGNDVLEIHPLHGDKELKENIDISRLLMRLDPDAKIKLMPVIEEKDAAAKANYLPKKYLEKYPGKNPDAMYNGKVVEYESSTGGKSSIQNAIKWGKKQADFIVVHIPDDIDMSEVDRHVKGQLKWYDGKENLTVWVVNSHGRQEYATKQMR